MTSVRKTCRNPDCPAAGSTLPSQLLVCSRCKQAHYCSKSCQHAHWKVHKDECTACAKDRAKLASHPVGGHGYWYKKPDPQQEAARLKAWADSMPKEMYCTGATSAEESMKRLNITAKFVRDLKVGDWGAINRRFMQLARPINICNDPPLRQGDRVEVVAGNHVQWEMVGQRGTLEEYFEDNGKWGIDFDRHTPSLIMAGNLKRIVPAGT